MLQAFEKKRFWVETLAMIETANSIITEYLDDGYSLTLRQLYYQFVARGMIENKQSEYKRLGSIVNDGRMAGLIDWDAIEDRTRNLDAPATWASPSSIVSAVAEQYREDLWADQPFYCEVWVEKEALAGVVERACEDWRLPFFSCRGYVSQSEQYAAGQRLLRQVRHHGKMVTIFHLGDHDPSGIDMTRDNRDRLRTFGHRDIRVQRLALNMEQVEEFNPPPNPAKDTDARFQGYRDRFGDESWELDALDPRTISGLINDAVKNVILPERWARAKAREEERQSILAAASNRWEEVTDFLQRDGED